MTDKFLLMYRKQTETEWQQWGFSEELIVGAGEQCSLQITDGELSAAHFEIRENPTGIYIKDVDAESGDTTIAGETLLAGRPTALGFNQEFTAGTYVFQIVLNASEEVLETRVSAVKSALKAAGTGKILLVALAVVVVAVIGGLLIYNQFIKPMHTETPAANATAESVQPVSEIVATLVPTEMFELASTAAVFPVDELVTAPGMGDFDLSALALDLGDLSVNDLMQFSMNPDQLLQMATTISGQHVGYVYTYAGIKQNGKIIASSMEFVNADDFDTVDGVEMPVWADAEVPVELFWEPALHYLEDGATRSLVLLMPMVYGADENEQVYRVDGIYQAQGSDSQYAAMLRFAADGTFKDILTFGKVDEERGTPYKVNAQPGDTFTPYQLEFVHDPKLTEEMTLDLAGDSLPTGWEQLLQFALSVNEDDSFRFGVGEFEKYLGEPLTFGENDLWWTEENSPDGEFFAGIAVEDLDGNLFVGYIPVLVQP